MSRIDIVLFGATGYTGKWAIRQIVGSKLFEEYTLAVAGRSASKLRDVLDELGKKTGKNLQDIQIIQADVGDPQSLAAMAARARVIINTAGPFQRYGEVVVKAAIDNGASHVDVSGEQPYYEKMALKYGEEAREKGVYIVSACGWDSIPTDLGIAYLKDHFDGDLGYVESYAYHQHGPAGFSFNTGTYESVIAVIEDTVACRVKNNDRALMPLKVPKSNYKPPFRFPIRYISEPEIGGVAQPFFGADATVVRRSQYYDYVENHRRPVEIKEYLRTDSLLWTILFQVWFGFFAVFAAIPPTRWFLRKYPDCVSFGLFKKSGPTEEQILQATFSNWHIGYGWKEKLSADVQHTTRPNKKVIVKVHGPDAAYIGTAAMLVSTALTILKGKNLPEGGVHTTASAFAKTEIYDYFKSFGISFDVIKTATI